MTDAERAILVNTQTALRWTADQNDDLRRTNVALRHALDRANERLKEVDGEEELRAEIESLLKNRII